MSGLKITSLILLKSPDKFDDNFSCFDTNNTGIDGQTDGQLTQRGNSWQKYPGNGAR